MGVMGVMGSFRERWRCGGSVLADEGEEFAIPRCRVAFVPALPWAERTAGRGRGGRSRRGPDDLGGGRRRRRRRTERAGRRRGRARRVEGVRRPGRAPRAGVWSRRRGGRGKRGGGPAGGVRIGPGVGWLGSGERGLLLAVGDAHRDADDDAEDDEDDEDDDGDAPLRLVPAVCICGHRRRCIGYPRIGGELLIE